MGQMMEEHIPEPGGSLSYSNSSSFIASRGGVTEYFNGIIDDVRVYDVALSDEQVWGFYLEGAD